MKKIETAELLTSNRRLTLNVFWNLFALLGPFLAAIVAFPKLIEGLGEIRFGILGIAWMIVGYFNLFDLGLSRALTKLVAEKHAQGHDEDGISVLIWTSMLMMLIMGLFGMIFFYVISPWLANDLLKIPHDLKAETLTTLYLLSTSIPIVIITSGLRGILAAHQQFGIINAIRAPLGIFTFPGPLVVLPFSNSLTAVVGILVVGRIISCGVYALFCLRIESDLQNLVRIDLSLIKPLISFGGWITISNIVGPLMVYMDRFLIGSVVSMTAVTYYLPSYEVASRLLLIPGSIMQVIFPALTTNFVKDRMRTTFIFNKSIKYIFIMLFPVVLIIFTFAQEGLNFWVGSDIASNGSLVLQVLILGVLINSLANVPFGMVQAAGRPDLTGKLHFIELPFYILLLWILLDSYGIIGVAIAWTVRITMDAFILFAISKKILKVEYIIPLRSLVVICITLFLLIVGYIISDPLMKVIFIIISVPLQLIFSWFFIMSTNERNIVSRRLRGIFYYI